MSVLLRPVLAELPAYAPGRTVPGAIKLASNETPYPMLPHVVERVAAFLSSANRYPDNSSSELRAALAAKFSVSADQLAVGCGSVSLCTQLVQALADAGDEVVFAWRSFEAYPILTAVSGARSVPVPVRDHVHDLPAMAAAITDRTRLVFVCNPNNPTGTTVRREQLVTFLRAVPEHVVVALDEAYREFVTDPDVPDGSTLLAEHPNVIVLRTFSKAYGLAGLRVGYAIAADPVLSGALRRIQVPFAVTTVAQQAALACLEPTAETQLMDRVAEIVAERSRVVAGLAELGYDLPPTQANFVWFPLGAATAAWAEVCEQHKVIVRAFAGAGVRVTISSRAENDRFLDAAAAARTVVARLDPS